MLLLKIENNMRIIAVAAVTAGVEPLKNDICKIVARNEYAYLRDVCADKGSRVGTGFYLLYTSSVQIPSTQKTFPQNTRNLLIY